MKKLLSLIICFVFVSSTVFASGENEALKKVMDNSANLLSADYDVKMNVEVNEPLEILNTIPIPEEADIDLRLIAESLISAVTDMSCTYSVSSDYKKAVFKAEISSDTPIVFSDAFKLNAWAKIGMWFEYDFTNTEKPVYKMLFKLPFYKKYVGVDMSEYFAENPNQIPVFDKESMDLLRNSILNSFIDSAQITKDGNNYLISFGDASAKEYILAVMEFSRDFALSCVSDEDVSKTYDAFLDTLKTVFDKVTILGENGMRIQLTVNSDGFISVQNTELHLKLNVFDILEAFSKSTDGLERDKSVVNITFKITETIKNHNNISEISFPEITEDNSDIMIFPSEPYSYDSEHKYFNVNAAPVFENQEIYYPISQIAEKCGFEVVFDEEKVTIDTKTAVGAEILYFNSTEFSVNDEEKSADTAPVIQKDGEIYCSGEAWGYINTTIYSTRYNFESNSFSFSGNFWVPQEDEAYIEDTYEYVPSMFHYGFSTDGLPYLNNGEYYMPVYEFVGSLSQGEFTFGEGRIEYAMYENQLGITFVSACVGDEFVTVDGNIIPLTSPVIEVDGIIRVPQSLAQSMGINISFTCRGNAGGYCITDYYMNVKNPNYSENDNQEYNQEYNYQPKTVWLSFNSERSLYVQDDVFYIPAYEFIESLCHGEFAFDTGYMEYTASGIGRNPLKIEKITLQSGDSFITVNDERIELEKPVIEVDEVLRIPVSTVRKLGITIGNIDFSASRIYCSMQVNNSQYVPENEFEEQSDNNWFYKLFEHVFY